MRDLLADVADLTVVALQSVAYRAYRNVVQLGLLAVLAVLVYWAWTSGGVLLGMAASLVVPFVVLEAVDAVAELYFVLTGAYEEMCDE